MLSLTLVSGLSALVLILYVLCYVYFKHCYSYWEKKGIPSPPATFPVGHIGGAILQQINVYVHISNLYHEYKQKGHRHMGMYYVKSPVYIPIDTNIIKSVLTTDFDYFSDRGVYLDQENSILTGNLFALKGQEWRDLRKLHLPTFTTGKIKQFFDEFLPHCKKLLEVTAAAGSEVNIKFISMNYSGDMISSFAFGIDSQIQDRPENELSQILRKIFRPNLGLFVKMILMEGFNSPGDLSRPMHDNESVKEFFKKFTDETIKWRESDNRNDFVSIMLQSWKKNQMSYNQLVASFFIFYFASHETVSQTITFAMHELAHNLDCQDKLRQEIRQCIGNDIGNFTYENLSKLSYLDKVFNEVLRIYPIMGSLHRICLKPYRIPGTDIILEKGTPVLISLLALQRDPEFFPDPLKFDPHRFDDDKFVQPFAFLPFGEGPRICIGKRFGGIIAKLSIACLISQFEVKPSPKTPRIIEFDKAARTPAMSLNNGVFIQIRKIVE